MECQAPTADGARLWVQTFGADADPAVLLIGGAASPMDYWEDGFCARLAAGGRRVIRFDARDTGRSTTWPVGEPGYTARELNADPLAVLDTLGIERAHVVGLSMGAGIALAVAAHHPGRVLTLTVASTSPGGDDTLPPPRADIAASFAEPPPETDWSDRAAVVAKTVGELRAFTGTLPFDERHVTALVERIVDRSPVPAAAENHWLVLGAAPDDPVDLGSIGAPTLVWHGTADPLFPLPHGVAVAERIPGARLLRLDGVGHEYPPPSTWDLVIGELLAHTAQSGAR